MKKIFVFIMMFFLICPTDSFSQEKTRKSKKQANIETVSKKRAKAKAAPKNKKEQSRRQKSRIKNNKEDKLNNLEKK